MSFTSRVLYDISDVLNVKAYGAVGDGTTDDTTAIQGAADVCFGTSVAPHATNATLNRPLYFPPGSYRITSPITLTRVRGGHIFGAGRFATVITNSAGGNVFNTNGFEYSRVERMELVSSGSAVIFNLNWGGPGLGSVALQSNTFSDIYFTGGNYGVAIAASSFMGSENIFLNCFWGNLTTAGLVTLGTNALQNTVIGGNFQTCGTGILQTLGSVVGIYSVGFQESSSWDISCPQSSNCVVVSGCRSESQNFITSHYDIIIDGCLHSSSAGSGTFANLSQIGTIKACASILGKVVVSGPVRASIKDCKFNRSDWIDTSGGIWSVAAGNSVDGIVDIENIEYDIATPPIKSIIRQRITGDALGAAQIRNLEIQAASLSDTDWVVGRQFYVGDQVTNSSPIPGGTIGWVCTTAGIGGTNAVFKTFGSIAS